MKLSALRRASSSAEAMLLAMGVTVRAMLCPTTPSRKSVMGLRSSSLSELTEFRTAASPAAPRLESVVSESMPASSRAS